MKGRASDDAEKERLWTFDFLMTPGGRTIAAGVLMYVPVTDALLLVPERMMDGVGLSLGTLASSTRAALLPSLQESSWIRVSTSDLSHEASNMTC